MNNEIKVILERIKKVPKRLKNFINRAKTYDIKVAYEIRRDITHPPGKTPRYIKAISKYIDKTLKPIIDKYKDYPICSDFNAIYNEPIYVWVCWFQGEDNMPEAVQMCYKSLKNAIDEDKMRIVLITWDNYKQWVEIPEVFMKKFNEKKFTMTHLSDILRGLLLEKYGGYWVDSTVLFTGKVPIEYYTRKFYCQKMEHTEEYEDKPREASGCRWCGFSMGGEKESVLFKYMNDCFLYYWNKYDTQIDYVLIDYVIGSGYRNVPAIKALIDSVEDNNKYIFDMRKYLNLAFDEKIYKKLTDENVIHKMTYKEPFDKIDKNGNETFYGYLVRNYLENGNKTV